MILCFSWTDSIEYAAKSVKQRSTARGQRSEVRSQKSVKESVQVSVFSKTRSQRSARDKNKVSVFRVQCSVLRPEIRSQKSEVSQEQRAKGSVQCSVFRVQQEIDGRRMTASLGRSLFPQFLWFVWFGNQRILPMADYYAVDCPRIPIQFCKILNQTGSHGIQVYVANPFQEVYVFFADNRFVPVLEEVAAAFMALVEGHAITRHQAAHNLAQWSRAGTQQGVIRY